MCETAPVASPAARDRDRGLCDKPAGVAVLELLATMEEARQGDRREGILLRQSRGWFSVAGMGQEGVAALAYALRDDDIVFPYYRDRALCLARGLTTYDMALAFFAASESSSGGRQMPGHYGSASRRLFSVATPTASQCLPAAGAAWAARMERSDRIVICCVGDAAIRQGEYYEAVAFAVQENLPLILVIEDNGYGISTATAAHHPYRLGVLGGDYVIRADGRDVDAVYAAAETAVARARSGSGPSVLWFEMDRLCPHTSSDDHRVYRSEQDIAAMAERDPIDLLSRRAIAEGILAEDAWQALKEQIACSVERDYERASSAAKPEPVEAETNLYCADPIIPPLPDALTTALASEGSCTIVQAVTRTLAEALARDPRVIMFGEDIEDPKGGVFGLTRGLSTAYPARVVNSPLAEATIVGLAVGLSAQGWKPVFELQFVDFAGPAFSQITNQAATLRWRTNGDQACPMVILAPCGAYLPGGGIWHSQTNEGIWAHVPGLRICIPSAPADAAEMLWTAMHMGDPVLYLIPKHLFRRRMPIAEMPVCTPGRAVMRRAGDDVTLVTWGNCTELALECAERSAKEGVSVEVLDLRWLNPCDWDGIAGSLARTGRLIVLHEDSRTGGFGDTIVAEMTSRVQRWDLFLAPPQIVARRDVPVPFAPVLEYGVLPDAEGVMRAIHEVMG